MLEGKHVVLGVCGGVAAYKAVELGRQLTAAHARVSCVLTPNATRFVGVATFAALTSDPPRVSLWDSPEPSPHTDLGQSADVIVVAPATARLIGSYANGISDDLLTTTLLASRAPVVLAPAMHTEMWEHPAVRQNMKTLRSRGVLVVDPESGPLAGGDVGPGRLAGADVILEAVQGCFRRDLAGSTVVVTAGGTREPLDPVRFIGNRSSGKQGNAIATEAAARGAKVVLITTLEPPQLPVEVVEVETAAQMHDAVMRALPSADVLVMAAAVADFRPADPSAQKVKKEHGTPEVVLEPTQDILQAIAKERRPDQVIAGFAAETSDLEANARAKLQRKSLDIIVANDVTQPGAGMGTATNRVLILDKNGGKCETETVSKRTVAATLLDEILRMRAGAEK